MSIRTIFSTLLLILFYNVLNSQNSYSARLSLPSEIVQGESVIVSLDIYKPKDLRNYTTFTQKLPDGFFVKATDLAGAIFSYKDNEFILTWLRISGDEKVTVTYELSTMIGITGSYNISGNLTYLIGNKQGKFDLKNYIVTVVEKKAKETITENSEEYKPIILINKLKDISCSRRIVYNKRKDLYDVEIKLKKKSLGSYTIVEKLPKNFEFKETESLQAEVYKNKSLVQYYWKKVPESKELVIKYQLKPNKDQKEKPRISGKLSFLSQGQIINMVIITED